MSTLFVLQQDLRIGRRKHMRSIHVTADREESVATGALVRLSCCEARPDGTRDISVDTPVLTCRMKSSIADQVMADHCPSSVIVGYIGVADDVLIVIRVQFDGGHVCWIGDLAHRAISEAVETWRREGQVPMVFYTENGEHVVNSFCVEMSPDTPPMPLTLTSQSHRPSRVAPLAKPDDLNESGDAGEFFIATHAIQFAH